MSVTKLIERLIADLDTGRADGTVYTYGQVQERLRAIADADEEVAQALAEKYGLVPVFMEDKIDGSDVAAVEWVAVVPVLEFLTAQLQAAQTIHEEAERQFQEKVTRILGLMTENEGLTAAIKVAKAEGWDECLDAIEKHELNTEQARAGNPYRASIEQTEADRG